MGLFAALYYWWPKITGRMLHERLGSANFWLYFIGMNLTFFPMHLSGLLGMPRRIYTYGPEMGVTSLNQISTIGAAVLVLGTLLFMLNVLWTSRNGRRVGANPWGGATLEWHMSSPPPVYNFAIIPTVNSRFPLWDNEIEPKKQPEHADVHMPPGSFWPVVVAIGIVLLATGVLTHVGVVFGGAAIVIGGAYGWVFEPFEV